MNFIKEENLESSVVRKGLVSGLLLSTLALTVLTTSSVIGEESKVYAKTNNADTNILMRVDTKNGTEELKEKFENRFKISRKNLARNKKSRKALKK